MRRSAVIVGSAFAAAGLALALHRMEPAAFDFIALYASASLIAAGHGAAVTDPVAIAAAEHAAAPERIAYLNNPNLPVLSLIISPLARLPYEAAYAAMLVLSAAALALAATLLARRAARAHVAVVVVTMLAPPSIIALAQGQTTPFVLAALLAATRSGPIAGGLLLSSSVFRPQLLPLMAVIALAEARRAWAFAAGVAVSVAASFFVVGFDGMARYLDLLRLAAAEHGNDEIGLGPSLVAAGVLPGLGAVALNAFVSAVVLVVGALAVARASRADRLSVAGTWSLLGSPHALFHDLLFAYPAVAGLRSRVGLLITLSGIAALLAQLSGIRVLPLWLAAVAVVAHLSRPASRAPGSHDAALSPSEMPSEAARPGVSLDDGTGSAREGPAPRSAGRTPGRPAHAKARTHS